MKTISVVIPAYNEEGRLGKTLGLWEQFLKNSGISGYKITEVIVADDGSSDKTSEIAESFRNLLPVKTIKISPNRGKGFAVKTGVKRASGDLIFIYDADAAVMPEEINKLLFYAPDFDVIIGSRTIKGSETKMSFLRRFVGFCFHIFCYPLIPKIKDASCGAKLFGKEEAKKISGLQKINRFAFDVEILWLAKKLNFRIKEVGLKWQEIPDSKVKIFKDGSEMFFSVLGLYKRHFLG